MNPELWTIVPMRGIARGKTRLAPSLDEAARARLNRWLFSRTLDVIRDWSGDLGRCVVVSRCPEVFEIASVKNVAVICESDAHSDQNRAASIGAEYALQHGASRIALLPCDLPDISVTALNALCADAQRKRHMTIAPDEAGTGTNAVIVDAHAHAGLCFGVASFPRYLAWAEREGWTVTVCREPGLVFDLDTPEDWKAWSERTSDARLIVEQTHPLQIAGRQL